MKSCPKKADPSLWSQASQLGRIFECLIIWFKNANDSCHHLELSKSKGASWIPCKTHSIKRNCPTVCEWERKRIWDKSKHCPGVRYCIPPLSSSFFSLLKFTAKQIKGQLPRVCVCACLHVSRPAWSVCVDGRSLSKVLSFKPSASLRGGLQAQALHNVGRRVTSPTSHNEQSPFLSLCFAPRRKQERPNRPVGKFTDFFGEEYITKHCVKDFLRSWNIVLVTGCLALMTVTHKYFCNWRYI